MKVIKNTTIYLGVSVFQSFLSFLLLPVFTYFLTQGEFGLVSIVNSVAGLLGIFFLFGAQASVSRLYFEYKDDKQKLKIFLGTIFLSKILWNIFLALIIFFGRDLIFPLIAKEVDFYPFLLIAIGIGFFYTLFTIYQTLQQTKQQGTKYAIGQIAYLLINNGITVILLIFFDMKAEGVILGTLIADVLMTLFVFYRLRKQIVLKINTGILKESISYSWPILFHALFAWSLSSVNKLILNNLISIDIVGVYTIGFVIAGVLNMITVAMNKSYKPWFFNQMKKEKGDNSDIVKFTEFTILVYAIFALGLTLFSPEVINLFINETYQEAWKVIPFLSFGYVFNGMYFFFIDIFNYKKDAVRYIPLYSLFSAIINIALNYILIPKYGMIGSALSTMISMIILSVSTYLGSRHFLRIGFSYVKMLPLVFLPFLMSLFVFVDFNLNFWVTVGIKIVYAILCLLFLGMLNRKKFGENFDHQLDNLKEYINGVKGNYKSSK
jgi:O-antigen/teichoic acid export membrane protein